MIHTNASNAHGDSCVTKSFSFLKKSKFYTPLASLIFASLSLVAMNADVMASESVSVSKNITNPTATANTFDKNKKYKVGDVVTFGQYFQSNEVSKEPIEWRVLKVEDKRVLLTSVKALESLPYSDGKKLKIEEGAECANVTWEQSYIRRWLNIRFMRTAFTEAEKNQIILATLQPGPNPKFKTYPGEETRDQVFLLSYDEVKEYFKDKDDRILPTTDYAKSKYKKLSSESENVDWALRTPGKAQINEVIVKHTGKINLTGDIVEDNVMIRPAIWVKLK